MKVKREQKKVKGRQQRKRWYSSENRIVGLSHNKVFVLTALDRQKHSFNRPVCYGHIGIEQTMILQHMIKENSILITDGERSYRKLQDVKLKQLKFGKPQSKVYHLSNIKTLLVELDYLYQIC